MDLRRHRPPRLSLGRANAEAVSRGLLLVPVSRVRARKVVTAKPAKGEILRMPLRPVSVRIKMSHLLNPTFGQVTHFSTRTTLRACSSGVAMKRLWCLLLGLLGIRKSHASPSSLSPSSAVSTTSGCLTVLPVKSNDSCPYTDSVVISMNASWTLGPVRNWS